MDRETAGFWEAVHERWSAPDREREEDVALSVLVHFARRLPGPEAQHLKERLPAPIQEWPELEPERRRVEQPPAERTSYTDFVFTIARENGIEDPADADAAARGVFRALGRVLPDEERRHIAAQLPRDFQMVWNDETT
jgi:uncharacterized protein (DUF2267 family)